MHICVKKRFWPQGRRQTLVLFDEEIPRMINQDLPINGNLFDPQAQKNLNITSFKSTSVISYMRLHCVHFEIIFCNFHNTHSHAHDSCWKAGVVVVEMCLTFIRNIHTDSHKRNHCWRHRVWYLWFWYIDMLYSV